MRLLPAVTVLSLYTAVVAFASPGRGASIPWATILPPVAASILTWLFTRRKQDADTAKSSADAELAGAAARKISVETIDLLFKRLRELQASLQAAEDRAERLADEVTALREEVARLKEATNSQQKE